MYEALLSNVNALASVTTSKRANLGDYYIATIEQWEVNSVNRQ